MSGLRLNEIACADALTWCRGLPDTSVDAWWSSPPYNLADPFRGGNSTQTHERRTYAAGGAGAKGDGSLIPEAEYQRQQIAVLKEWYRALRPDGVAFYSHKVRIKGGRAISPLEWLYQTPFVLLQELVWDRGGTAQVDSCRFLPVSERVYVLTKRPGLKLANVQRVGDVLRIPPTHHRRAASGHPCPTHPALVGTCLSVVPRPADGRRLVVADCYAGSGTTWLVANAQGMDFMGCDVAPQYVALAQDRVRAAQPQMALPLDLAGATGAVGAVADAAAGE